MTLNNKHVAEKVASTLVAQHCQFERRSFHIVPGQEQATSPPCKTTGQARVTLPTCRTVEKCGRHQCKYLILRPTHDNGARDYAPMLTAN